jgi:hypothetical protein
MNRARALYQMVRADFLERVRRYSFLLTLGFSVYLGYAVYAGQVTLQFDKYRGVDNSAWLGSVIGLVGSVWLSLVGFYIVKNSIQRDRQTRVGQILATTPISKGFYTLSKTLSNFAVLAAMVLVLAAAALVVDLSHSGLAHIDLFALLAPVLVLGLSALAVTAALALLFESLPVLRGGVGNIFYFFFWTALIAFGAAGMDKGESAQIHPRPFIDYTGIVSMMSQMQAQVRGLDPQYNGNASFSVGGLNPATKTFLWTGMVWNRDLLLSRVLMLGIALMLALLAALFFDRFDPARAGGLGAKDSRRAKKIKAGQAVAPGAAQDSLEAPQARQAVPHLTPLIRDGSNSGSKFGSGAAVQTRFFSLVTAELRLQLLGHAWWWYAVAAGLFIGCLASPLDAARGGVLVFAWIWPALIWSQMGTRETQFSTGSLIFSAPRAVPRQLLALFVAGVAVAALTGGGLALRLIVAGHLAALAAWAAAALFIPALALALGVITGSRKFFEALYTAWWYTGPLHHIRGLDFMGTTAQSSTPVAYLVAAAVLVMVAYSWRKVRLARA